MGKGNKLRKKEIKKPKQDKKIDKKWRCAPIPLRCLSADGRGSTCRLIQPTLGCNDDKGHRGFIMGADFLE